MQYGISTAKNNGSPQASVCWQKKNYIRNQKNKIKILNLAFFLTRQCEFRNHSLSASVSWFTNLYKYF